MKIIEGKNVPIKSWCNEPEEGAVEQARNLASLPFIFKHVALMPDTHQGYGMPIGGVIATKNVIIPNAVGVDIGCFSGDTKVSLLNGLQKSLKELAEARKSIYVYSLNENLNLVVGKAFPKLTRRNANMMEVVISGGESIRCTPDHKFMLLDGTYKEAKDLRPRDSLMPLYRSYESKDGYEHIRTGIGKGIITHRMVTKQFLGACPKDSLTHHKDECWYNNDPSNLEYKNKKLHSKDHNQKRNFFITDEFKVLRIKKLKEKGFYSLEFYDKKKQVAIENMSEYNKSDKRKDQDKLAGKRGAKFLIKYNKSEKGRKKSSEIGKKFGFGKNNHKVLFTKQLDIKEDVYCLTVEKYHNFALASGIFVHNCGMCAMKTSLTEITNEQLKKILGGSKEYQGGIRSNIPVGFNHHSKKQDINLMPGKGGGLCNFSNNPEQEIPIIWKEFESALKQIGTLGGGNHFIEIQKGSDGYIWVMIHSGSRNLGYTVARHYNQVAQELCKKWYSNIPAFKGEDGLAFLPMDTVEGQAYFKEMNYCLEFAYANRKLMLEKIKEAFLAIVDCEFEKEINIHHNYAIWENHFGQNVIIHRKGATSAKEGQIGIIPGSQGTASYIVKGKGNPESFQSCSHGAGRAMSRKKARETLSLKDEQEKLDSQGILHAVRNKGNLDEASGAYKNIEVVMEEQKDLVDIVIKLQPLAVVKG